MSAIWGQVSFDASVTAKISKAMRDPYEKKCRIDKITELSGDGYYFGAGIQFITAEAEYEKQPIAADGQIFAADCILDNRDELISLSDSSRNNPSMNESSVNEASVNEASINETLVNENPLNNPGTVPDGTIMFNVLNSCMRAGRASGTAPGILSGIKKFLGIFSFALYGSAEKKLTLAVDPTSSRCLYYRVSGKTVTFSTLIEPILKAAEEDGVKIGFNENYLKDFICAPGLIPNLSAVETPYEGVYKIEAGHYLEFTAEGIKNVKYFSPSGMDYLPALEVNNTGEEVVSGKKADAYGKAFRRLFETCVAGLLRSENTAMALSSGFDSGSVGAIAADILEKRGKKLTGYTYIPYEKTETDRNRHNVHNEKDAVLELAGMHPGIEPHFLNNGGKNSIDPLEEETKFMEIPFKAYGNFPSLCEIYQSAYDAGCRTVLNGQFGNSTVSHGYIDDVLYELWKSGHKFRFLKNLNHYSKTVSESRKAALKGCRAYFEYAKKKEEDSKRLHARENTSPVPEKDSSALNKGPFASPEGPFINPEGIGDYSFAERMAAAGFTIADRIPESAARYRKNLCSKPPYSYIGEMETKMSLKYGVVLRDATRDPRMLQFCSRLPYELFAHNGVPRWLIRGNLSDLLPESIKGDWLRYGVQNSDCYTRIKRDWETISREMERRITENRDRLNLFTFIDTDRMLEFLNECKTALPKTEEQIMDFLFAYELVLFIGIN